MDWWAEYQQLSERDREQMAAVLSRLFEETFLVREVWDPRERRMRANPDYRFVERHLPLLEAYLQVAGWAIQVESRTGVAALYNRFGRNRHRFDKWTTYLLYGLRLVYEEKLEDASQRREVVIALRELLGRFHALGLLQGTPPANHLKAALNSLRRWNVLERIDGEATDPDSRWILYPTIRFAVTDEAVQGLFERLKDREKDEAMQAAWVLDGSGIDAGDGEWEEIGMDKGEAS
ncbi:MAG: DUF4194 domain-containing protein [Alicyclobacillaceae bacterium]|nr:DUF4194 domain-containing protein [Alicyclobacillaceae bacterium]